MPRCQRPGPKPTPLAKRTYKPKPPVQQVHIFRSKARKIDVLLFLQFHRKITKVIAPNLPSYIKRRDGFPADSTPFEANGTTYVYQAPSFRDASAYFKIPYTSIQRWWTQREQILDGTYGKHVSYRPHWPQLEEKLMEEFEAKRAKLARVSMSWFRRNSRALFLELYPDTPGLFVFSPGWFNGFLRRHSISRRRITKKATVMPANVVEPCNSFVRFIRRQTYRRNEAPQRVSSDELERVKNIMSISSITDETPWTPCRRIRTSRICNMDETPLPFEYLDGYTYDTKGAKTIAAASVKSGWDKRQATLVLCIWANGIARTKPKIIFHGSSTGRLLKQEQHLYHPDVSVAFNPTAYNNEELMLQWLDEDLHPGMSGNDGMLVLDSATFHLTDDVKNRMKELHIIPAVVPPGMTSLLQPLDTAVNRPLKDILRDETDLYISALEAKGEDVDKWTASQRRIMTTHVVAISYHRIHKEKADMLKKSFIDCGISIRPDGSQDKLVNIKGVSNEVLDWTGWEVAKTKVEVEIELHEELPAIADIDEFISADDIREKIFSFMSTVQLEESCRNYGLDPVGDRACLLGRLKKAQVAAAALEDIEDDLYITGAQSLF